MSYSPSRATAAEPNAPPFYVWQVPGKPVTAHISLGLIDRLERDAVETFRSISAKGSELGGLLIGRAPSDLPGVVTLDDYELVACGYSRGPLYRLSDVDLAGFDAAIERITAAGARVTGFFRSHTRKGLMLDPDDMAVLESRFRDPLKVALLVRPFATKASAAGIFIWEDGQIHGEASYLEFPFQSAQLASSAVAAGAKPPARAQITPITSRLKVTGSSAPPTVPEEPRVEPPAPAPAAAQASAPEPASVTPPVEQAAQPSRTALAPDPQPVSTPFEPAGPVDEGGAAALIAMLKKPWVWGGIAAAILACSGILFMSGIGRKANAPVAVPLTLRVERTATDLLLSWNRDSDVIRNAKNGSLSISDGERRENYDMDMSQLRTGSIVYSPLTADVSFRLEVVGADQSKVATESVRVLRTRPSPMADPKAAAQQQAAAAASPAAEGEAEAETPAPARAKRASKEFNVASLADRLRPAQPTDVPEAPVALPSSGGSSINLGVIAPSSESQMAQPAAPVQPVGNSTPQLGALVRSVNPVYPANAKLAQVSGSVRVTATVGTDGKVRDVKVVSGPMMLQGAAAAAVRQWVYTPTMLNGVPVEIDRDITLNFVLPK